ncbi:hypothetical protein GMST_06620 [Geomonas silvestris]|uniref:histidine kinase n=1 Tax=Geomonas silvestris TaxID=2740184 RepID=A0A6V8MEF3_9BACT|nr:ATP-binding protein [Geomonas silvestris]GFO58337.1 hypothetical protein GMST_06620 [Geomonas silvestris]
MPEHRTPEKIVLLYAVVGCLWILFSDRVVITLFRDPETVLWVSQLKGWGFVLVTSLLLYWLIRGSTQRLMDSEALLRQQAEELEIRVQERTHALSQALAELQVQTDERLRVVEELREKERLLAQQSRQAAMGEMIGNIAHQWRQPLNALALTIQQLPLLHKLGELNEKVLEESIRKAMKLIKHMSRTIDDFRDFFSPDKEITEFRIDKAVHKALELLRDSLVERSIAIEVSGARELTARGYPNEYAQVLLNILVNARDAFDSNPVPEPRISIQMEYHAAKAVVTVTDNAGGVPAGILDSIFEPYFSTKGLQGTGIGLYMSKTIIERNMRGTLSVRNTGSGAQFRIEI